MNKLLMSLELTENYLTMCEKGKGSNLELSFINGCKLFFNFISCTFRST